MTLLAAILAGCLALQYFLNARERRAYTEERASLLDRIQHPEVRQVEPGQIVEHDLPKDEAELAQVGQIVPEFVKVGMTDGE